MSNASIPLMNDKSVESKPHSLNSLVHTWPPSSGSIMLGWKTDVFHMTDGFSNVVRGDDDPEHMVVPVDNFAILSDWTRRIMKFDIELQRIVFQLFVGRVYAGFQIFRALSKFIAEPGNQDALRQGHQIPPSGSGISSISSFSAKPKSPIICSPLSSFFPFRMT